MAYSHYQSNIGNIGDIVKFIKFPILHWLGNVQRLEVARMPKKILNVKIHAVRKNKKTKSWLK